MASSCPPPLVGGEFFCFVFGVRVAFVAVFLARSAPAAVPAVVRLQREGAAFGDEMFRLFFQTVDALFQLADLGLEVSDGAVGLGRLVIDKALDLAQLSQDTVTDAVARTARRRRAARRARHLWLVAFLRLER